MVVHINGCDVPASKFVEVHGLVKADKSVAAVRPFSTRLPACARAPCPCPRPRTLPLMQRPSLPAQTKITDLGEQFDMESYNEAVKLMPAFKHIF